MQTQVDELCEPNPAVRDLAAIMAHSAGWQGRSPQEIIESLADLLLTRLDLVFVYVCVTGLPNGDRLEVAYAPPHDSMTLLPAALGRALEPWLTPSESAKRAHLPNPLGSGMTQLAVSSMPLEWAQGVVVAGATHPAFPTAFNRLILTIAVKQAVLALQSAHLKAALHETIHLKERLLTEVSPQLSSVEPTTQENALLAELDRQQVLSQLLQVQEAERRQIARELHDSLGQYLAALNLGLKTVQQLNNCTPPVLESLQQLSELTQRIDKEVDRLAFALRPAVLDDFGLQDALQQYVQRWRAECGIAVDLHTRGLDNARLPEAVESTFYRIIQEALTNVHQHAAAAYVTIIVERRRDEVLAIIEDNGRGFDLKRVQHPATLRRKLGLSGMAERAALCQGRLDIESTPGRGTTIYVHIPIPREQGN